MDYQFYIRIIYCIHLSVDTISQITIDHEDSRVFVETNLQLPYEWLCVGVMVPMLTNALRRRDL